MALFGCVLVLVVFGAVNGAIKPNYLPGGLATAEPSEKVNTGKEMILKAHREQLEAEDGPYKGEVTMYDDKVYSQVVAGTLYHFEYKTKTTYTCKEGATCENKEPEVKECTAVILDDFVNKAGLRFHKTPVCT